MSTKSKSTKSRPILTLDTRSLRNISIKDNNLVTYTLLTFFLVLGIYFVTKDWKGITAPEEVNLGSVRVVQRTNRRSQERRRTH